MDNKWKVLYKVGGITAVVSEVILILSIAAYPFWPYLPGNETAETILLLLQDKPLAGLIGLDFLLVVGNILGVFLFLALYVALKPANASAALVALALGLMAVVWIIPARPIMELFAISDLYAGAATEAARSHYLAMADTLLALFNGTSWFMNTLFGGICLLINSILMLRSDVFSKVTAYVGIVTNTAVALFFIPGIGFILLFLSLPGYMVWYIQLARQFFLMSKEGKRG